MRVSPPPRALTLPLQIAQLTASVLVGYYGTTGDAANVNRFISIFGVADASLALARIFLESIAFQLGPAAGYKFHPATDWANLHVA